MKSILQIEKECYICKSQYELHNHHIYFGSANREISERNGFKCWLCSRHHKNGNPEGVHERDGHELDLLLKQKCQEKFEETKSREEFRELIGRSYL